MTVSQILPLVIGLVGLGTVVFAAMRWRRDDVTAAVGQQAEILQGMKTLSDESRESREAMKIERDECKEQVAKLHGQVGALRDELRHANERLSGQVERVQRKLDDDSAS